MRLTRGWIQLFLILAAIFFGWKHLSRSAHETAVLHTPDVHNWDTYTTLWVVEDDQSVWIRAESRDRLWLDFLRGNPHIELRRNGRTASYRASLQDTERVRAHVDPIFREKYGLADQLRELVTGRETIPIRLERL
jgi:hypothetical protein